MTPLKIEVSKSKIVVTKPNSNLAVTSVKDGSLLVAEDTFQDDPAPDQLSFLVRAWKVPYVRAKELHWI
jgi:hypothetical protein